MKKIIILYLKLKKYIKWIDIEFENHYDERREERRMRRFITRGPYQKI